MSFAPDHLGRALFAAVSVVMLATPSTVRAHEEVFGVWRVEETSGGWVSVIRMSPEGTQMPRGHVEGCPQTETQPGWAPLRCQLPGPRFTLEGLPSGARVQVLVRPTHGIRASLRAQRPAAHAHTLHPPWLRRSFSTSPWVRTTCSSAGTIWHFYSAS